MDTSTLHNMAQSSDPEHLRKFREDIMAHAKYFKTSWVELGQGLYTIWNDKLFHKWGHEKFEHYVVKELGLNKSMATRLLKTYYFVEEQEPTYLKQDFKEAKEAAEVPNIDTLNVLRLARNKKELTRDDYAQLRKSVFETGKDASAVRKDLVSLMKERKPVDPEEERQQRMEQSLRKAIQALKNFRKDMETLKLVSPEVIKEADELIKQLEDQLERQC